jgi:hypothetical protein
MLLTLGKKISVRLIIEQRWSLRVIKFYSLKMVFVENRYRSNDLFKINIMTIVTMDNDDDDAFFLICFSLMTSCMTY